MFIYRRAQFFAEFALRLQSPHFFLTDPGLLVELRVIQDHGHFHVVLVVAGVGVYLEPGEVTHIMANPVVGQSVPDSIEFRDQHGGKMVVQPVPDSPPTWVSTTAGETLTVAADGLSCSVLAVTPGANEVDVTVVVGGVTFKAAIVDTVVAAPQVLTSVAIVQGTPA